MVLRILVLFLVASSTFASAGEWPTLHRDNQRSGYSPEIVDGPYERKWYRKFTDEMIATRVEAILAERRCYVGTFAGNLYALNVESGSTEWRFESGGPIGASACYDQGRVFVGSDDETFYCLDAGDGSPIWQYKAGAGIWAAPVCDGERVYFGDRGGTFHAVNARTGKAEWRFESDGMILTPASLSADGERIVFGSEAMRAYCLSSEGELLWRSQKLGGLSLRDHAPTIWKGLTIVRTNPAKGFHEAAGTDPRILTETQKGISISDDDEVLVDKWGQYVMRLTDRRLEAERQAVIDYLKGHRSEKTFYAFNLQNGEEPWTAPILYTAGLHNPGTPPTFNPKTGEMYVIFPTALDAERGSVPGGSIAVGKLDRESGLVEHLSARDFPYPQFLQPADETQTLQLMGDRLLNTHQGSITGMTLPDREWKPVWTGRDTYGGIYGPSTLPNYWDDVEPYMKKGYLVAMANEWHGPDRAIASVGYDRLFWVVGSVVVSIGGPSTPMTESGGAEAPSSIHRKREPVVPAGNVAAGVLGEFDPTVKKRVISTKQIESVVADLPSVDSTETETDLGQRIQAKLDAEIAELIDRGPWAPLIVELGISGERRFFWRTSQTMQTVALAMPHLSSGMKQRAKDCLDELFQSGVPLEKSIHGGLDGKRREAYDLSPAMRAFAEEPADDASVTISDVYSVWAYAHFADGWDNVSAANKELVDLFDRFASDEFSFSHEPDESSAAQRLNAQIAGVLGYVRIMRHLGESAEVDRATEALSKMVTARVHHERADTRFVRKTDRLHGARIPRYVDLVPEVSELLGRFCPKAVTENARSITEQLPVWYHAFGERLIGGENYITPPDVARGLFAVLADGVRADPKELIDYLDQPWCRADLYYIEKLSAVLRALYGK